jgi:5-hydroxyisourate hydrolase
MPPHRQPTISTHVLDNERGQPAVGVRVVLERRDGDHHIWLADAQTDTDGRIGSLLPGELVAGIYRISFDVGHYFALQGGDTPFMRTVSIELEIVDTGRHYHVPLLATRFTCTAYRGS